MSVALPAAGVPPGDPTVPVHAVWHPVRLEAGPYVIDGEVPMIPGFDPDRALTRPTGSFVELRNARLCRSDRPGWGPLEVDEALVNRYVVESVEAELSLGFFVPGATMIHTEPDVADIPRAAAVVGSVTPTTV